MTHTPGSLNPYSNGILSDAQLAYNKLRFFCLNPYSNGILSDTLSKSTLPFYAFPILQQNPP